MHGHTKHNLVLPSYQCITILDTNYILPSNTNVTIHNTNSLFPSYSSIIIHSTNSFLPSSPYLIIEHLSWSRYSMLLLNLKFNYHCELLKSSLHLHTLFLKDPFSYYHLFCTYVSKTLFLWVFLMCYIYFSITRCLLHAHPFNHPHNIRWIVQIIKLLIL
jgi:hypothetical protein